MCAPPARRPERLAVEVIDLYYLHRVDPDTPIEENRGRDGRARPRREGRFSGFPSRRPARFVGRTGSTRSPRYRANTPLDPGPERTGCSPPAASLGSDSSPSPRLGGFFAGGEEHDGPVEKDFRRTSPRFEGGNLERNVELLRAFERSRGTRVHPRAARAGLGAVTRRTSYRSPGRSGASVWRRTSPPCRSLCRTRTLHGSRRRFRRRRWRNAVPRRVDEGGQQIGCRGRRCRRRPRSAS